MGLRRVCTPRDTRKLLAKVQLHRKVYRHTRKYMKIILKGSQRHIDTRPTAHFISTPPSSHSPFLCVCAVGWKFSESVRIGWAKWVFRCVSNEFIYIRNIWNGSFLSTYSTVFWKCIQAAHCSLGSFIIPFPFVSLCLSLSMCVCCVCVCERVRCFLCHLHTLHYVSGVRCIFFGSLASLHSVGGSGCFFCIHYSTFLSLSFFRLFNVHSTLYNSNTECILNRSIYIICLSV